MDATKPGNGSSSPFGNGNGATSSGGASGSHDFVTDPSSKPTGKGLDVTKQSVAQPKGDSGCNPDTIPPGGPTLKVDPPAGRYGVMQVVDTPKNKPFKL